MRHDVRPWNIGYLTFTLQALRARFFASVRDSKPPTVPQPCAIPTVRVIAMAFHPLNFFHVLISLKHSVLSDLIPKLAAPAAALEIDPKTTVAKIIPIVEHLNANVCSSVKYFMFFRLSND